MIYYIGENITSTHTGADVVNLRNISILKKVFRERFDIINITYVSKYITFLNLLIGCMCGLSPYNLFKIVRIIKQNRDSHIFLSSSKLGILAYFLKKYMRKGKICVFFHNIEKQYMHEEYRVNKNFKNWLILKITSFNEKLSCKYGDYFIVLNNRDKNLLQSYYNLQANLILPISFEDKYNEDKANNIQKNDSYFNLLFVGSAFFANIEAVNWFISEVMPQLPNCKLTIVGNKMNEHFHSSDNIEVHGYVDDLSIFYYQCDMVVSPILSGGGMKTKTAEALMYGCPIIGTKEAFEGFDLNTDEIGACCNQSTEMVNAIKDYINNPQKLKKCSNYARSVFKSLYTVDSSTNMLKNFVNREGLLIN